MLKDASKRRLCMRFERGDSYWYLDQKGFLASQNLVSFPGGKPRHRVRNSYNFIRPIVEDKVSSATQRIPGYDVTSSTTDPEDIGGARLAEKVAVFGYDKWYVRDVTVDTTKLAIGHGGDGFAFPYFDSTVGPFVAFTNPDTGQTEYQGQGEVKILTLSGNEAYWEAGVKFRESPWHAFERAEPLDLVMKYPGYLGGPLSADASTSDVPNDAEGRDHMVMVTNYLERPSQKNPKGRWLVAANGRLICKAEDFPVKDTDGTVLDEPALHRLRYQHDPENDRDLGLTWQLIDAQRTVQDCWNKLIEWKNRCLNPQMLAPKGSMIGNSDDEPGLIKYFNPVGGMKPEWETPPPVPEALFRMLSQMKQDMREMAAYEDVNADPNLAAKTIQQVIQQSEARWQSFLGDLAEWHSRLMRHCLLLVANYYTEPRLLEIRGRFGPELISDFKGSKLMGQVNVRVNPGSLQYRSQQEIQNKVTWIAQTFPGYLTPEQAIGALDDGTSEKLIRSYELDEARANRIISKIRDGTVMDMPARDNVDDTGLPIIDPQTGLPEQVPTYMPDMQDNEKVWLQIFSDWMKTTDYESLVPAYQFVAKEIYSGIRRQELIKAQQAAMIQTQMAEQQGMQNAAKTPAAKPMPSLPAALPPAAQ